MGRARRLDRKLCWRQGPGCGPGWELADVEAKGHWRQEVWEQGTSALVIPSMGRSPRG